MNSGLNFSEFLLEDVNNPPKLDDSKYHKIDLCNDNVIRHAPFIICPYLPDTENNIRQYERIFTSNPKPNFLDPRPEHTNLCSDSYNKKCKPKTTYTNKIRCNKMV